MRSIVFLTLCAAASSAKSDSRNAEEAMLFQDLNAARTPSDKRYLQEGEEGIFRATWGTDHTGSCAMAAAPTATMSCENDAEITLLDETEFANCATTSMSEISCVGNLGTMFYSAEFSCAAIEGELPGASATLLEETEDCLGDTPETGTWVHGIQLFLMCDGEPDPIGMCDPEESVGENNACSLGYTCAEGSCTAETLRIPDITSSIEQADCSITMSPTASPAPSGAPTAADSASPTISAAPSESPAPSVFPTSTPGPSQSPQPSVAAADTTMPTTGVIPTMNGIVPTEPGASPTSDGGSSTPEPTAEPTSGSSIYKITLASVLTATVIALVAYF